MFIWHTKKTPLALQQAPKKDRTRIFVYENFSGCRDIFLVVNPLLFVNVPKVDGEIMKPEERNHRFHYASSSYSAPLALDSMLWMPRKKLNDWNLRGFSSREIEMNTKTETLETSRISNSDGLLSFTLREERKMLFLETTKKVFETQIGRLLNCECLSWCHQRFSNFRNAHQSRNSIYKRKQKNLKV